MNALTTNERSHLGPTIRRSRTANLPSFFSRARLALVAFVVFTALGTASSAAQTVGLSVDDFMR